MFPLLFIELKLLNVWVHEIFTESFLVIFLIGPTNIVEADFQISACVNNARRKFRKKVFFATRKSIEYY